MGSALTIRKEAELDFLSLGALVHRLDPGIIPFRKATECAIHVSGGEFNVAANLADCFGLNTAIATAMVDYPIGDLIAERVRAMGVRPFYRHFKHDGVNGPNMATVYSDRGYGVRAPVVFYNRVQRGGGAAEAGRLRLEGDLCRRRALVPQRRHFRGAFADDGGTDRRDDEGGEGRGRGHIVRPELPREALEDLRRSADRAVEVIARIVETRRCAGRQRRGSAEGTGHRRAGSRRQDEIEARSRARSSA